MITSLRITVQHLSPETRIRRIIISFVLSTGKNVICESPKRLRLDIISHRYVAANCSQDGGEPRTGSGPSSADAPARRRGASAAAARPDTPRHRLPRAPRPSPSVRGPAGTRQGRAACDTKERAIAEIIRTSTGMTCCQMAPSNGQQDNGRGDNRWQQLEENKRNGTGHNKCTILSRFFTYCVKHKIIRLSFIHVFFPSPRMPTAQSR